MSQGDTVTLRTVVRAGGLDAFLELYDGSRTQVATSSGSLTRRLDAAGPYTVLALDSGNNDTGDYHRYPQRLNNPCNPTSLSVEQMLSGSIASFAEIETYNLPGINVGNTVTLCMASGAIGPSLELYGGSGKQLAPGSSITKQVATAGPYNEGAPPYSYRGLWNLP